MNFEKLAKRVEAEGLFVKYYGNSIYGEFSKVLYLKNSDKDAQSIFKTKLFDLPSDEAQELHEKLYRDLGIHFEFEGSNAQGVTIYLSLFDILKNPTYNHYDEMLYEYDGIVGEATEHRTLDEIEECLKEALKD